MELPLLPQQTTASRPRVRGPRTHITPFLTNGRPVPVIDVAPSLEEHPAMRKKNTRLVFRIFGSRDEALPISHNTAATVQLRPSLSMGEGSRTAISSEDAARFPPSSTQYTASLPSERRSGRRRHIEAWVRRPRRKHGYPGTRQVSYRTALKDRAVRKNLATCTISGFLLLVVVAIYLGFAVAFNSVKGQEFHILLILLIMIFTIFFCHSLVRTCMLVAHTPRQGPSLHRVPSTVGPLGYAQPEQPIHIVLARDEEIALEDQGPRPGKIACPPPAYGLWRSSVRINPNLIYWQRVNGPVPKTTNASEGEQRRPATANRPPSYASDNGVDYVIDAQPRSIVPDTLHSTGHDSPR